MFAVRELDSETEGGAIPAAGGAIVSGEQGPAGFVPFMMIQDKAVI